jgi:RNA recognition motif-containing protein
LLLAPFVSESGLDQCFRGSLYPDRPFQSIKDKFTNQSRGFGFVEMATEAQATEAIKLFNGKELGGRNLVVNESRPQEKRNFSGGDRGGSKSYGKRW